MPSPMGIIAASTPMLNNPTPAISSRAPTRNSIREDTGMGASVRLNTKTMQVMGRTEVSASRVFSLSCLFIPYLLIKTPLRV